MRRIGFLMCVLLVAAACDPPDDRSDIERVNADLGRGINLGNMLEAPREGDWGLELDERHFELIANAGFDHVRMPVRWSAYAGTTPPFEIPDGIDPTISHPDYDNIFQRVDWAIDEAAANDLMLIVNVHHYEELMADPAGHTERFLAIWNQIATRYADAGPHVVFELLNEPSEEFNENPAAWNELLADSLAVVRATNPDRPVVIGPVGWNDIDQLDELDVPDDPHLITSVHFYAPFDFTHQGATWVSPVPPTGTEWDPDLVGFDPDFADHSWNTEITSTPGALLVDYGARWSGLAFSSEEAVDPVSLDMDVTGNADLRIVCDMGGQETEAATVSTGSGALSVDLTSCGPATTRLFLQNSGATWDRLRFTSLELCMSERCEPLIAEAEAAIAEQLARAAEWGDANGIPIHLGEFGAYGADGRSDLADRAEWTRSVQTHAVEEGMSSAYWEFGAGFGAYDLDGDTWVEPLRSALLDPAPASG